MLWVKKHWVKVAAGASALLLVVVGLVFAVPAKAADESGSVGLQGRISAPPPTTGATISVPGNGQTFTTLPVTVSGLCPGDLLVKLFKNEVFAGSVQCKNGSYSMLIDLFSGQNELVARVYDNLDQPGPDSNHVTVTFADKGGTTVSRPSLTSNFAKRGTSPGKELTWPIVLTGGSGPYAISVDWGDGKAPDLISIGFPGPFEIKHIYDTPGVYNIIVKAVDREGGQAFLQLVGVANGPLSQDQQQDANKDQSGKTKTVILWQPAAIMIPLMLSTFWLGRKYELKYLKKRLERGDRPF